MSKHSAEWWSKRVMELARGGDAERIASRHGVRASSLKWWRWELARRARERVPRLLPVVVEPAQESRADTRDDGIEVVVECGAVRVCVRGAVTVEHLAALMGTVSRAC
jgi:transposase-like protein